MTEQTFEDVKPEDFPRPVPSASEVKDNPVTDWFTGPKVRGKRPGQRPEPKKRVSKSAPPKRKGSLKTPLEEMYTMIGVMITPLDNVCGPAIVQAAPKCAETLDELAYQNDAVRRILTSLVTTSTVGAVFAAHIPIVLAIAIHHVPAVKTTLGKFGEGIADKIQEANNTAPVPTNPEADAA